MTNTRDKLNEAKHFLEEMRRFSPQTDAFRYTYTAFLSAIRSITLVMQKEFSGASGFSDWYANKQAIMENHSVLKYLHRQRNLAHHERPVLIYPIGVAERVTENNRITYTLTGTGDTLNLNPVFSVPCPQYAGPVEVKYYFSDFTDRTKDVMTICQEAITTLEKIVAECEGRFIPAA